MNENSILFSNELTKRISLNGLSPNEVEKIAYEIVKDICDKNSLNIKIYAVRVYGSRITDLYSIESDLDIIIAYTGSEKEDGVFNILNEEQICIYDMKLDFNPIHPDKSGTLEEYLEKLKILRGLSI